MGNAMMRMDDALSRGARESHHGLVRLMADVLFPRGCAGCAAPGWVLCPRCEDGFGRPMAREVSRGWVGSGQVWCSGLYSGSVRNAILRWKDHHDEEVDAPLARAMRVLACAMAAHMPRRGPLLVVPVPSSPASARRRGRRQTHVLADAVAHGLARAGVEARMAPVLRMGVSDKAVSSGHARDRAARVRGRIGIARPWDDAIASMGIRAAVLVDDIVTTGATMGGCASALRAAGFDVPAAFALACAPGEGVAAMDGDDQSSRAAASVVS